MKKPINKSQILALGSFFSIAVLLLGVNLMKNTLTGRVYSTSTENLLLQLDYKAVSRSEVLKPFTSLTMTAQFIDSLIFIPSSNPRVEVTGDKVLVENLRIFRGNRSKHLLIDNKVLYHVEASQEDSIKNGQYLLKTGGLVIKIYYQELNSISINEQVKTIVQEGVFKADQIYISAMANTAQFNIDAKYAKLQLEKPSLYKMGRPSTNIRHEYENDSIQYVNQPLSVVGKVDLVETINNVGSILDLTQLHCRHVHADYANAQYSILEVAPTQLFSYIIRREDNLHHSEMICKSKARVIKAHFIPELSLVERFH